MKKQLTKQQIEKRKNILHKIKNIIFYVSLAFNVLIGICLVVSGCSQSKSVSADEHTTFQSQLVRRNYAFNDDYFNNNSCAVYSTKFNNYQPDHYYYYNNVINTKTHNITIFSHNDVSDVERIQYLAQWEHPQDNPSAWYGHIDLRFQRYVSESNVQTVYRLEYIKNANVNYWNYVSNPNDLYIEAVGFNVGYLENIGITDLQPVFDFFFPLLDYQDYNLSSNWSPYSYFNLYHGIMAYDNSLPAYRDIIVNGCFSINGRIYTKLRFITQNSYGFTKPVRVYYDSNENYDVYDPNGGLYIRWFSQAFAFNDYLNETVTFNTGVWAQQFDDHYDLYPFSFKWIDYKRSFVRLYDFNLNQETVDGYVNGNVLNIQSNYAVYGGSGYGGGADITSTFTLFGNAFTGLAGIFSIYVLPGLTLGVLLFVPLIATIIFAIIKVIKK